MDTSHTLLSVSLIKGVGNVTLSQFNEFCKKELNHSLSPHMVSEVFDELRKVNKRIKEISITDIEAAFLQADTIIKQSYKLGIDIVTINDSEYPKLLKYIKTPPSILHCKGSVEALTNKPTVAVIGTRTPSEYGIRLGKRISKILVENEFTIVSGLALGCDTIGHKIAVDSQVETVAVLAGGLDNIYPKENTELARGILENGGLIMSEYPVGIRPSRANFVNRDRIQSGVSLGTLIIQTSEKGGTLHTAKFTQEQQRILACLATSDNTEMSHEQFKGNKKLINSGVLEISNKEQVSLFVDEILKTRSHLNDNKSQTKLNFT